MSTLDPRLVLATPSVASCDLEGLASALTYRPARLMQTTAARASIRKAPGLLSEQVDELVFGEGFKVLQAHEGFVLGQAVRDGYVGWVQEALLTTEASEPTHRVGALSTFAFSEPSIKSPVVHALGMNALVVATAEQGRFLRLQGSGWTVRNHLSPIGHFASDPAATALQFLGTPYLWGGRTSAGLDCSGLIQQAYYACGLACPRDSDQQMAMGRPLAVDADLTGLQRGDLIFWPGHVAMMLDRRRLIHANAAAMCVSIESVADAVNRIDRPSGFRRLG